MPTEVILPRVDMDMAEGRIAHWYVKDGERVKKGQTLFEIETDKATMEVDATADGVLHGLRGEIGVVMPVGSVVGWILAPGESPPASDRGAAPSDSASAERATAAASALAATGLAPGEATEVRRAAAPVADLLRATPLARQRARERGIDLGAVTGSGPNGRVLGCDVGAASDSTDLLSGSADRVHLRWLRRGRGAPLLLIHGFGADHASWRPLLTQLPEGLAVVGIDLPGHGKSAPVSATTTLQALARPVLERLDREGVIDFHLLGHSLGGGVALALAAMAVARVRSLTLLAPVGLGPDVDAGFIDGLLEAADESALKPVLAALFHRPALLSASFVATSFQQLRAPQRRAALAELARHLLPQGRQSQSLRDVLGGLAVPVQLIWGIADRVIPVQHALGLGPHVGLHLLPAVGHLPQVEAAAWVALLAMQQLQEAAPR